MKKFLLGLLALALYGAEANAYTVKINNPTKHTAFINVHYACAGCKNDLNVEVAPGTEKIVGEFSIPTKVGHVGGIIKPHFTDAEIAASEIANSINPDESPLLSNDAIEIDPISPNLFMKSGNYVIISGNRKIGGVLRKAFGFK